MRQRRKVSPQIKRKFAMVVDGETEYWYIQMLKRNEKINVDLKPEIPQKKKLKDQYQTVKEHSKHYDKVYWIIDFDSINKETREAKKGSKTALQEFKDYCDNLKENYTNVVVMRISS